MSHPLYQASFGGRVEEVAAFLRDTPDLDVNFGDRERWTAGARRIVPGQYLAFYSRHIEIVKLLLAHPAINVNQQDTGGTTAFLIVCSTGAMPVVRLLLEDPRADVTLADSDGRTPLWRAARNGHHRVIEWLIASGRDLGDLEKKGKDEYGNNQESTALEIASEHENSVEVSLLEGFMADPVGTRRKLQVKLGVLDELAAKVFAFAVFLCDDLLQLKPAFTTMTPASAAADAVRFFAIISKLPMELQMVLSRRAIGSMKQNILRKDSEAAFKSLARCLGIS